MCLRSSVADFKPYLDPILFVRHRLHLSSHLMISFPSVTWESSPTRHGVTASFIELIYIQMMNGPNAVFVITVVIIHTLQKFRELF